MSHGQYGDARAILRMHIGLFTGIMLWFLLKSIWDLCIFSLPAILTVAHIGIYQWRLLGTIAPIRGDEGPIRDYWGLMALVVPREDPYLSCSCPCDASARGSAQILEVLQSHTLQTLNKRRHSHENACFMSQGPCSSRKTCLM